MENSERKALLLDTFDLLKSDYSENGRSLRDIIDKMGKLDFELAVEMWKYLIQENPDYLHETDDFGFGVMFSLTQSNGETKVYNYVYEDAFLKQKIYGESGGKDDIPLWGIRYFLHNKELDKANELFELALSNNYSDLSPFDVINYSIPYEDEKVNKPAFELIKVWIDRINNDQERAKLQLRLLDYLDNGITE